MDRIDLHTHSTASDGSMTPSELVHHAASCGLRAVALTDHDTTVGLTEAQQAANEIGIELVHGVELATWLDKTEFHIVGLDINENNTAFPKPPLARMQQIGEDRNNQMVARMQAAGVDITAGYRSVELMKQYVARTMNEHCIGGLGGFGGLFELDCTGYKHPVLISGTDGVGTKLKVAMIMDKHDTIGIDCVAMCVNDVICAGAKPLVFLDYIACGRNIPEKIAEIVKGVAEGCVQADCSLVGGETAEHPGMMPEDEYDLAGFTVGVVDKEKILSNETMQAGDVILALPSTGVHSNGFSLVRKIFDIDNDPDVLHTTPAELGGKTLGDALLAPTKIYVKPVLKVLEEVDVKGISHITGGGFYENIPRSLKKGCCARIKKEDVRIPALFHLMQETGHISEHDMFNTFNMGVGMVLTVPAAQADKALEILHANGEPEAYKLGVIAEGDGVELC